MATSTVYAFEYLAGFWIFGLVYWIFNGILPAFQAISLTGDVYNFAIYVWHGALVIYIVFGIWYFIIRIKTWKYFNQ